jgi:hypothetical protein
VRSSRLITRIWTGSPRSMRRCSSSFQINSIWAVGVRTIDLSDKSGSGPGI